jgi:hypothetical protein
MVFHKFCRRISPVVSLAFLVAATLSYPCQAQMKSAAAGIMLRAVLPQSLTMSANPEAIPFNSFIASNESRDFPVTFKTNWVRGPGEVSFTVLVSKDFQSWSDNETVAVIGSSAKLATPLQSVSPALRIDSTSLGLPVRAENEVLTIRAQAL